MGYIGATVGDIKGDIRSLDYGSYTVVVVSMSYQRI